MLLFLSTPVEALYITGEIEVLRIPGVGAGWQTISTQNSYTSPVVVCTYVLPSDGDNEAVVRVRNAGAAGFDVRIQRPQNGSDVTPSDVYCLVAEDGVYSLPDGRTFEAHTVLSDGTNGLNRGWGVGGANGAEDVSAAIGGGYMPDSQPAVLGQVMTYNDTDFSAFWSFDCDRRRNVPFQSSIADGICVGKHVGQIGGTGSDRAPETLGYIVIAEGSSPTGNFNGISYRVDLGADSVRGVGNSPPYTYALGAAYDFAVANQEAEDGGQGGWAVLYGTDPLAGNAMDLAIDEETVAGDTSRTHITEQVAYWAFSGIDHGDAPPAYGDASHGISGLLSIGSAAAGDADAETGAQSNAAADGDDNAGIDDEDGVTFRSPSSTGQSIFADVAVNNATGGSVTVCGWLDVPSGGTVNGIFDSSDGSCQTTSAANPTLTFQWSGLPQDQQYTTYARFRVSTNSMTTSDATGYAFDGEVEDYQVFFDFTPTAVTIGEVTLEAVRVSDFLAGLDIEKMGRDELLALLTTWDPKSAAAFTRAGGKQVMAALYDYLDPDGDGRVAVLKWDTLEERGTIGFRVERSGGNNQWTLVNNDMLPGLINAPLGGQYQLADPTVRSGRVYQYRLIEQEADGHTRQYG
ncbi:MAG: hypothetical protein DSY89_07560, partial [Deltaproteobacteria bacterium]